MRKRLLLSLTLATLCGLPVMAVPPSFPFVSAPQGIYSFTWGTIAPQIGYGTGYGSLTATIRALPPGISVNSINTQTVSGVTYLTLDLTGFAQACSSSAPWLQSLTFSDGTSYVGRDATCALGLDASWTWTGATPLTNGAASGPVFVTYNSPLVTPISTTTYTASITAGQVSVTGTTFDGYNIHSSPNYGTLNSSTFPSTATLGWLYSEDSGGPASDIRFRIDVSTIPNPQQNSVTLTVSGKGTFTGGSARSFGCTTSAPRFCEWVWGTASPFVNGTTYSLTAVTDGTWN